MFERKVGAESNSDNLAEYARLARKRAEPFAGQSSRTAIDRSRVSLAPPCAGGYNAPEGVL